MIQLGTGPLAQRREASVRVDHFSSPLSESPSESDSGLPRPPCYAERRGRRGGKRPPTTFDDVLCNAFDFVALGDTSSGHGKWTRSRALDGASEPRDLPPATCRAQLSILRPRNMEPMKCSRWTRSLSPGGGRNFLRPQERVFRSPENTRAKCSAGGFFAPLRVFSHTVVHNVDENILGPPG